MGVRGVGNALVALGIKRGEPGQEPSGISAGTGIGDLLEQLAAIIKQISALTGVKDRQESRFGALAGKINQVGFLLTEGTDEDLSGFGRFLRDAIGKPVQTLATAPLNAAGAGLQSLQNRANGNLADPERQAADELAETGNVSLASQDGLRASLENRVSAKSGKSEINEAGNRVLTEDGAADVQAGVDAFQGNVLSQKLGGGANIKVSSTGPELAEGKVLISNGDITQDNPGVAVDAQDVRRAIAGDAAALERIKTALNPGTAGGDGTTTLASGGSTGGGNNSTVNGADGTDNTQTLANQPGSSKAEDTLKQVQAFAKQGVKGFEGAEIVNGEVTLTNGRTVTASDDGGLEVSGGLDVNGTGQESTGFTISGNAISALEGNNPIVSDLETQRLINGVDAGLNLSAAGVADATLNFNANAKSTNEGVVGDRNNSVQLTFGGITPEAAGRGLTVSPDGAQQLSIRGLERAANNNLSRGERSALGLSENSPRALGLGADSNTPGRTQGRDARRNARAALDAAFGGAGITDGDRSAQQSATDRSNLGQSVNIFGSLRNRSVGLGDPTEQLRDDSLKQAAINVTGNLRKALTGVTDLDTARGQLADLGFSSEEQNRILGQNQDGSIFVSRNAVKKALEGRVGITRTAAATRGQTGEGNTDPATNTEQTGGENGTVAQSGGANTTQDVQAVINGNEALRTFALRAPDSTDTSPIGDNNVLGSFTISTDSVNVGEGEPARGNSRITGGTGTGENIAGDGSGQNTTEANIRQETARRLSQSTAQGGLGIGRIDANSLVFNDDGQLEGVNVNGQTQSLEEFAASNAELSSAIAKRRNRILGLSGDKAEGGLSAEGILGRANDVAGAVRSESNSGLNNSELSGASSAARTTLAALRGGNRDALQNITVNGDGSIGLSTENGNFLITKDGNLQSIGVNEQNEEVIGEAFANQILGQAADSRANDDFRRRREQIEALTNDINDAFQVNLFGFFKVGETVSNINVDFDADGNITGAGVKLDDGSTFNLANDPATGSLRAINARGKNGAAINQSVNGGINYFNQQSRAGAGELAEAGGGSGFVGLLRGIGAENISVDERDINSGALRRDDNNNFNNNFAQEGRLRFDLNGQYFDVGYAIDKNGGVSLNLDGATDAQKAAIESAFNGQAQVLPQSTLPTDTSNSTDTPQREGVNRRANAVIAQLAEDEGFKEVLATNDPGRIRSAISNALQGSDINREVSDNLAAAITNSNVTISAGQNLANVLNANGISGDEATAVANALQGSNLIQNNVFVNRGGPDSANVLNQALEKAGITDEAKRKSITDGLLANPSATFNATQINTGTGGLDATTQFARLFGAGNRGNNALLDINGNISQNLSPAQQQNARTQYDNTVAAERAVINSIANTSGAGNARFLTTGLQAVLGDERAGALVSTDNRKLQQIAEFQNGRDGNTSFVGLTEAQAQERLNTFLRSEGLENNSIKVEEIANLENGNVTGLKDIADVGIAGRVNVEASYDGRSQITGENIEYGPEGNRGSIPSLSITQDSSGNYTVNVGGAADAGQTPNTNSGVQDSLRNRFANPDDNKTGAQKFGEGLGSFVDKTTRFLGETLDAVLPGLQAYKKAMEDLEEARVRLKAANDQVAAAKKYAEEMGVTFGNTNIDGGGGEGGAVAGGGAVGAAGAAGGAAQGGATGGGAAGGAQGAQGSQGTNGGGDNNGPNGTRGAGSGEGAANTGAAGDNATPVEAQEAETAELLSAVASDSNFANIAVLIGLSPGMLIEQAQQMDMLEQLGDTIQQLQSPFNNPVQSMREFVERLESAQSGAQLPQDGIVL